METMVKTTERNLVTTEERVMNYLVRFEMENWMKLVHKEMNYLQQSPAFMSQFSISMDIFKVVYARLEYAIGAIRQLSSPILMEPIHVNDIIRDELVCLQSYTDSKKVNVSMELGNDVIFTGSHYQIGQCLNHLFQNALDACTDHGSLMITTWTDNDNIYVEIRDTGTGMTPGECGCMFIPFYTTKKDRRGLGAYIAQRIIENHGGTITVDSLKNHGTTIRIQLPK